MRRAVIIVNIVVIVVAVINVIFVGVSGLAVKTDDNNADTGYSDSEINSLLIGVMVIHLIGIVFSMLAIFGAIRYNIWPVAANIAYLAISFIVKIALNVSASNSDSDYTYNVGVIIVFGLIFTALYIYPHAMFIREVRSGTMTNDNYDQERQSCCCV
jgi:cytochrome bd-type quinol oxidase subunit 2